MVSEIGQIMIPKIIFWLEGLFKPLAALLVFHQAVITPSTSQFVRHVQIAG